MKNLNALKFVANASEKLNDYHNLVASAESFEDVKAITFQRVGFINCMVTFMNNMLAIENNDFTEQLDELIDIWMYNAYQDAVYKAIDTHQNNDLIAKLLNKRDKYRTEG